VDEQLRNSALEYHRLPRPGKISILPTKQLINAANIAFNLLKTAAGGDGVSIGPILVGAARAVHILTPSATVRRIVDMTALTVVDAGAPRGIEQSLF